METNTNQHNTTHNKREERKMMEMQTDTKKQRKILRLKEFRLLWTKAAAETGTVRF